jgi:hypothetical protein
MHDGSATPATTGSASSAPAASKSYAGSNGSAVLTTGAGRARLDGFVRRPVREPAARDRMAKLKPLPREGFRGHHQKRAGLVSHRQRQAPRTAHREALSRERNSESASQSLRLPARIRPEKSGLSRTKAWQSQSLK